MGKAYDRLRDRIDHLREEFDWHAGHTVDVAHREPPGIYDNAQAQSIFGSEIHIGGGLQKEVAELRKEIERLTHPPVVCEHCGQEKPSARS